MNTVTPLDVKRAEFAVVWRGYDKEAVESFLATVSDEMERLVGEARELGRRVGELEKEVAGFRSMERTLMDTLVTTQRTADEVRETARRESDVARREAQVRAEQTLDTARIEAERISLDARHRAYRTLEEAREEARRALDLARRETDEIYRRTRERVAMLQDQVITLVEGRDSFVASFRAGLEGQLAALAALADREAPEPGAEPAEFPLVRTDQVEAIAALDREIARLGEEDAAGPFATEAERADGGKR